MLSLVRIVLGLIDPTQELSRNLATLQLRKFINDRWPPVPLISDLTSSFAIASVATREGLIDASS
jgi:hypothetical protein